MASRSPQPIRPVFINSRLQWQSEVGAPSSRAREETELAAIGEILNEIARPGMQLDRVLALIAQKTELAMEANGTAIVIAGEAGFVCRARSGKMAPPAGTVLDVGSGLSGECIRSGEMVRCDDTESDARVNAEASRELGIRSVAGAPLSRGGHVIGLVEAFAARPDAFSDDHVSTLRRMGSLVVAAMERAESPPAENPSHDDPEKEGLEPLLISGNVEAEKVAATLPRRQVILAATLAALIVALGIVWAQGGIPFPIKAISAKPSPEAAQPAPRPAQNPVQSAAEAGDANAQFETASLYLRGNGVNQDYQEAAKWFALAAQQGHVGAQSMLGTLYFAGRGLPKDYVNAYMWSSIAAASGNQISKTRLVQLSSRMTTENLLEARRRAAGWMKTHPLRATSPAENNR